MEKSLSTQRIMKMYSDPLNVFLISRWKVIYLLDKLSAAFEKLGPEGYRNDVQKLGKFAI